MKLRRILDFLIFVREYKNWREILAAKLRRRPPRDIIVQLRKYNLRFKIHLYKGHIITFFKEIFIKDAYHIREFNLKDDSTIIDVGSTIGLFVLFVKSFFKKSKVIACEPLKENFELLKENIALNRMDNCICHNAAVGAKSGRIGFIPGDTIATGHVDSSSGKGQNKGITVDCLSLEDIFEEDRVERCDLLKLDCEGAEYDILFNLNDKIFDRINNIVMETHAVDEEKSHGRIKHFLITKGYNTTSVNDFLIAKKNP